MAVKINYKWERLINPNKRRNSINPWQDVDYWKFRNKEELKKAIIGKQVIGFKDGRILIIIGTNNLEILPSDKSVAGALKKAKAANFLNRKQEAIKRLQLKGISAGKANELWEESIPWTHEDEVIELALRISDRKKVYNLSCQCSDFRQRFNQEYGFSSHITSPRTESAIRIALILRS